MISLMKSSNEYKVTKQRNSFRCQICNKMLGAFYYKIEPISTAAQQGDFVCSEKCVNMYILQEI
jgi:hypothetical protein